MFLNSIEIYVYIYIYVLSLSLGTELNTEKRSGGQAGFSLD